MIKAILYDLDGVLVDAVDIHKAAFATALKEITGITISDEEHLSTFNGLPTKRKLEILVGRGQLRADIIPFIERLKQEMTIAQINTYMYPAHGKIHLHKWAADNDIKVACVTNSIRQTASLMLERTGQLPYIQILITNQDVKAPKPDPEGYLKAMERLGVTPAETLIIEDSPKGIEAAKATGAKVMVVSGPNEVTIENVRRFI